MQYNFNSFVYASSSFFCFNWWWRRFLIISENHLFGFHVFFSMSTLFRCSTRFSAIVVFLKVSDGPPFWICSLLALLVLEMYFWPWNTGMKLIFFEMYTSLEPGAQMLFRHEWRKLDTLLFFPLYVGEQSRIVKQNELFFTLGSTFGSNFSRFALLRKRLHFDSQIRLTSNGLILNFFVEISLVSSLSYLHGLRPARIAH